MTPSPATRNAFTAARTEGRRSASVRQTAWTCRRIVRRTGTSRTPSGTGPRPSRGATQTPNPAAISASCVWCSPARCAMRGSMPRERSVNISHS